MGPRGESVARKFEWAGCYGTESGTFSKKVVSVPDNVFFRLLEEGSLDAGYL
jgi:hypothetical protein